MIGNAAIGRSSFTGSHSSAWREICHEGVRAPAAERIVDKTPLNFAFVNFASVNFAFVGLIHLTLPNLAGVPAIDEIYDKDIIGSNALMPDRKPPPQAARVRFGKAIERAPGSVFPQHAGGHVVVLSRLALSVVVPDG
jgi:hypothetical protein